jgi:hypothetical protein
MGQSLGSGASLGCGVDMLDPTSANRLIALPSEYSYRATSQIYIIAPDNAPLRPGQRAVLAQPSLFVPNKTQLEKIPFRLSYRYRCANTSCKGHEQTIIDWEAAQAFRNFRRLYGEEEGLPRMRDKWLEEMCGPTKNTHFFVGNQHQHPPAFLVLGVFWPPV